MNKPDLTIFMLLFVSMALIFTACETKTDGEKKKDPKLAEAVAWQRALERDTEYYYLKYGEDFPDGEHIKDAEEKFGEIVPGAISAEQMLGKRFTGQIDQVGDKKVFSLRFEAIEDRDGVLYFRCLANMGSLGKELNGTIDLQDNVIQFIETEEGTQMQVSDGRVYVRNERLILESTDLGQFWHLD